jgi:hypothetical protein
LPAATTSHRDGLLVGCGSLHVENKFANQVDTTQISAAQGKKGQIAIRNQDDILRKFDGFKGNRLLSIFERYNMFLGYDGGTCFEITNYCRMIGEG